MPPQLSDQTSSLTLLFFGQLTSKDFVDDGKNELPKLVKPLVLATFGNPSGLIGTSRICANANSATKEKRTARIKSSAVRTPICGGGPTACLKSLQEGHQRLGCHQLVEQTRNVLVRAQRGLAEGTRRGRRGHEMELRHEGF